MVYLKNRIRTCGAAATGAMVEFGVSVLRLIGSGIEAVEAVGDLTEMVAGRAEAFKPEI